MTLGIEGLSSVEEISPKHDVSEFDCGSAPLDEFLKRFALTDKAAGGARTYVVHRRQAVVGYYSLAAGSVEHDKASERVRKGMARHPIPVVLLARMAVDRDRQGQGIGKALVKDALVRTALAANTIGVRALLVDPKDKPAQAWWERFGFKPSLTAPNHLFLLMKDVRAILTVRSRGS